jgi:hypothetical protein
MLFDEGQQIAQPPSASRHVIQDEGIAQHALQGVEVFDGVAAVLPVKIVLRLPASEGRRWVEANGKTDPQGTYLRF